MRNALLCAGLLAAVIGCGSSSSSGTGGTSGAAGANGTGGTSGATGEGGLTGGAGKGSTAGNAGAAGNAGTAGVAGANGPRGSGGAAALVAGTYAGTAPSAVCYGFMAGAGCTVQITISGSGPSYQVTEFMFPGGATGSGVSVDQTDSSVVIALLTDGTSNFCSNSDYTATGTVGAGGTSISVMLTGPPCGSSDSVYVMVTLTKQ